MWWIILIYHHIPFSFISFYFIFFLVCVCSTCMQWNFSSQVSNVLCARWCRLLYDLKHAWWIHHTFYYVIYTSIYIRINESRKKEKTFIYFFPVRSKCYGSKLIIFRPAVVIMFEFYTRTRSLFLSFFFVTIIVDVYNTHQME
jgi:hypothetical protein